MERFNEMMNDFKYLYDNKKVGGEIEVGVTRDHKIEVQTSFGGDQRSCIGNNAHIWITKSIDNKVVSMLSIDLDWSVESLNQEVDPLGQKELDYTIGHDHTDSIIELQWFDGKEWLCKTINKVSEDQEKIIDFWLFEYQTDMIDFLDLDYILN